MSRGRAGERASERMPDIDAGIEGILLIIVGPRKFLALGAARALARPCILGYNEMHADRGSPAASRIPQHRL